MGRGWGRPGFAEQHVLEEEDHLLRTRRGPGQVLSAGAHPSQRPAHTLAARSSLCHCASDRLPPPTWPWPRPPLPSPSVLQATAWTPRDPPPLWPSTARSGLRARVVPAKTANVVRERSGPRRCGPLAGCEGVSGAGWGRGSQAFAGLQAVAATPFAVRSRAQMCSLAKSLGLSHLPSLGLDPLLKAGGSDAQTH